VQFFNGGRHPGKTDLAHNHFFPTHPKFHIFIFFKKIKKNTHTHPQREGGNVGWVKGNADHMTGTHQTKNRPYLEI